ALGGVGLVQQRLEHLLQDSPPVVSGDDDAGIQLSRGAHCPPYPPLAGPAARSVAPCGLSADCPQHSLRASAILAAAPGGPMRSRPARRARSRRFSSKAARRTASATAGGSGSATMRPSPNNRFWAARKRGVY